MSEQTSAGQALTVECSQIEVEKGFNPRDGLGDLDLLVASVARHGILQPLLVRPGKDGALVLVDGHRRLAAPARPAWTRVPVLVRDDLDGQALVAALVTALKREDLDPVEQAKAYGRLVDGGLTRKGAAEAVGVAQKAVTARLQILQLPEALHPAIATGEIALSSVPDAGGDGQGLAGAGRAGRPRGARPDDAWMAERLVATARARTACGRPAGSTSTSSS